MKRQPKEITPHEALLRLADLCARAEHSAGEMLDKLRRWHIVGDDADKIIDKLKHDRYIDDSRFARAFVKDKVIAGRWGRRKAEQAMYLKHIDRHTMREALSEIDEEVYVQNLRHVIILKIKSQPSLTQSYEGRTKLFRFVVGRGYEPQLAADEIKKILSQTPHSE